MSLPSFSRPALCSTPDALRTIAEIWRPVEMKEGFSIHDLEKLNLETLKALEKKGLLVDQPERVYGTIIRGWLFPLYTLDLSKIKVKKDDLREIQDKWSPYGYL